MYRYNVTPAMKTLANLCIKAAQKRCHDKYAIENKSKQIMREIINSLISSEDINDIRAVFDGQHRRHWMCTSSINTGVDSVELDKRIRDIFRKKYKLIE